MRQSNDELANLCLQRAWDEDTDDRSRWLLEQAARRINRLSRRGIRLASKLEQCEMREQQWQTLYTDLQIEATSQGFSPVARVFATLRDAAGAVRSQFARLLGVTG